jgi:23S rRNA (cytidine1920-2'-O)/16S rRNA (cytidine1409-2'-O)-methyltransferase
VVTGWFTPAPLAPSGHSPHLLRKWGETEGGVVTLIKPQFEAGRKDVSRGDGVIRDPDIHRQVLLDVLGFAKSAGFGLKGLIRSPILGPKGNIEFLAWMSLDPGGEAVETLVEKVIPKEEENEVP